MGLEVSRLEAGGPEADWITSHAQLESVRIRSGSVGTILETADNNNRVHGGMGRVQKVAAAFSLIIDEACRFNLCGRETQLTGSGWCHGEQSSPPISVGTA